MSVVRCDACPRGCALSEGATGACHARGNVGGVIRPTGYGRLTAVAIDPVEKKPLARWMPGSTILSLGGYGCNLRCPWCQNHTISQVGADEVAWQSLDPNDVVSLAKRAHAQDPRMVGVAYTYNEPLVCWEYVCDTGQLVHEAGFKNALVSAGCMEPRVIEAVAPLMDAANIDLKTFDDSLYRRIGGDLKAVCATIELLASTSTCHVEVTTLVVPGVNDTPEEMEAISSWLASVDSEIVLHVTRFHPMWRMLDCGPTPVCDVYALADIARRHLPHVLTGNC